MEFQDFDASRLPRNHKAFEWVQVASRPDGNAWQLPLLYVTGREGGPTLVVVAGVHGDEYEGVEAISRVFKAVSPGEMRGTLLMVPACNLPAYEAGTRCSPVDGLDLNRVLPGDPEGTITQRIGYWMTEKLMMASDLYIDLHSGGIALDISASVHYCCLDNSLGRRAYAAAKAFGAPVLVGADATKTMPGHSFRVAWDRGIPALFTEGPGGGRTRPEDVACYADGVLNLMKHLDMLAGEPQPRPTICHLVDRGEPGRWVRASVEGYFCSSVRLLEAVESGQQLGVVQDFSGRVLQKVCAGRDGCVSQKRALPRINVGDALFSIIDQVV